MATTGTVADNTHRALGGGTPTNLDLLNTLLAGDIQRYGYGYAILKNWGIAGDTVTTAKMRHYAAVAPQTLQDSELSYYRSLP